MSIVKIYPWLIIAIIILFIGINFFYSLLELNYNFPFEFKINKGDSVDKIADLLEKKGIISSKNIFKFYLILTGNSHKIKAGQYKIEKPLNIIELVNILTQGGLGIKIKIIPGMTLKDVEKLFSDFNLKINLENYKLKDFPELNLQNIFGKDTSLEGFLFPDTYEFLENTPEKEIITKILKNFQKKALPLIEKSENPYQVLIIASLLEKEIIPFEDKLIASDILWRRLKDNQKLEVDATIVYAKCKGYFYFCQERQITKKDLNLQNPYNTYLFKGLPPTPIANPAQESLIAAVNPKSNEFYFYLTTKEGKTIFSKTLEEHQRKIKIYLK